MNQQIPKRIPFASKLHKRGIIEDAIIKLKSAGASVGESLSSFYDKTTDKLSAGVESIRWSIISLMFWITIPTLQNNVRNVW